MKTFEQYDDPTFWDKRATEILNQNINYPDKINQYFIDRKVFIMDKIIKEYNFKTILDAGCGAGSVLIPLAIRYPKIKFYAVDFSKENIKQIEKYSCFDNIITLINDIEHIPIPNKCIDFLFSFDVLCHITFPKMEKVIKEFHRVSKFQCYTFHGLEYSILPKYYFMFSRMIPLPKKLVANLSLFFSKRIEKEKFPEIRGIL